VAVISTGNAGCPGAASRPPLDTAGAVEARSRPAITGA
jgi:hypothetical protein